MEHISVSQVNTYLTCGRQWYYRYIRKLIVRPQGPMTTGSCAHKGIEKNFAQKVTTGNDLHHDEIEGEFERLMREQKDETIWQPEKLSFDTALKSGTTLLRDHTKRIAPTIQPLFVEKKIEMELPGEEKYVKGYIDLMDVNKTIIEHKTSQRSWDQGRVDSHFQFSVYACHLFADDENMSQVNTRIDNLILKKEPEIKRFESKRFLKDALWAIGVMKHVIKGIEMNYFPPAAPGSWQCSENWCGYWDTCKKEMCESV